MSLDATATLDLQRRFAAHLRDPQRFPAPQGLPEQRLQIYRDLFYNSIEGLLATNFPVMRRLLADAEWHSLVRDFYRDHTSHTPLFTEVAREFQRYLESRADSLPRPFLIELAHYEWVELALGLDECDLDSIAVDPDGDVLGSAPIVSPLAWSFDYAWPVHRLSREFQPLQALAVPVSLVIVRNRHDEISFLELSPLNKVLLDLVKANPGATGLDLVNALADAVPQLPRETLVVGASDSLREFRRRDILLGTEPGS